MECFHLYDHLYSVPGLTHFLNAFAQPIRLHLSCGSPLTAAQCECLLSKCTCVENLILHGPYLPSILLLNVKTLRVHSSMLEGAMDPLNAVGQIACLFWAERLRHLEQLHLDLSRISVVCLIWPVQLHKHKALCIKMSLDDDLRLGEGLLDLTWAMLQPCCSPNVHVELRTRSLSLHAALVQQLSRARISKLTLVSVSTDYFSGPIQRLWSSLQVPKLGMLVPPMAGGMYNASASAQPHKFGEPFTLEALPQSEDILLSSHACAIDSGRPITVTWQALASWPARIMVHVIGSA